MAKVKKVHTSGIPETRGIMYKGKNDYDGEATLYWNPKTGSVLKTEEGGGSRGGKSWTGGHTRQPSVIKKSVQELRSRGYKMKRVI